MKEEKYKLEDKKEARTVTLDDGRELAVAYLHRPNVVGDRSAYTGLPIWVGETVAKASLDGETEIETTAYCWLREPYTYSRGRVVSTGRLLKKLHLPTLLAEQVEEE